MNNIFVEFLPPWIETGCQPAFYDKESGTCLQQTARMYDRVNMLIRMFNKLSKETRESFTELYNYVHDFFDNLDVQEEVDHKLDEMVEDGTLADIIAGYIQLRGVLAYDNITALKNATNIVDGSFAETYGYNSIGDGGNALYKIRQITNDDVVDDMFIIELSDDNLIGELIFDKEINIKQIGAYGDGVHDDTSVIQAAFNKDATVYLPKGTYLINTTINITNKNSETEAYVVKGVDAKILYTGNDFAINLRNVANARFDIGSIISTTGGNINMYATSYSDFIQYVTINFKVLQAGTGKDNIYASTTGDGWINEITLNNGRFYGTSANNIHLNYGCNNWNFNNVGFEGGSTGVYFENDNAEHSMGHYTFQECRHQESIDKYIKADGWVKDVYIYYPWSINFYLIETNADCNDWYVYSTDNIGSHLVNGKWQFSKHIKTLEGGENIPNDTNFNDLTTPGDYNFNQQSAINSALNKPYTKSLGKLTVQTFNNYRYTACPYILQTYLTVNGVEFTRTYDGNNWSSWDLTNQCSEMLIPENTDLNNLKSGSFFCNDGTLRATLSNVPSSASSTFRLDIKRFGTKFSGASCQQLLVDIDNNIYSRTFTSSWTAWKKVAYV